MARRSRNPSTDPTDAETADGGSSEDQVRAWQGAVGPRSQEEQDVDLAIKKERLTSLQRRGRHGGGGVNAVARTSPADIAKAAGAIEPSRLQTANNPLKTPGLDSLKPMESSVDRNGNAVATKSNPNAAIAARAQMSRASGGDGKTTIGVVTDDGWRDKAKNIADAQNSKLQADPLRRANMIAGMPGVNSISIRDGVAGKNGQPSTPGSRTVVGGVNPQADDATGIAGVVAEKTNSAITPKFIAPQAPLPAIASAIKPAPAGAGFTPPDVAKMNLTTPTPAAPLNVAQRGIEQRQQLDQADQANVMSRAVAASAETSAKPDVSPEVTAANNQTPFTGNAAFKPVAISSPQLPTSSRVENNLKSDPIIGGIGNVIRPIRDAAKNVLSGSTPLIAGKPQLPTAAPSGGTLPSGKPIVDNATEFNTAASRVPSPQRVAAISPATDNAPEFNTAASRVPAGVVTPKPQPRPVVQTAFQPNKNKLSSNF